MNRFIEKAFYDDFVLSFKNSLVEAGGRFNDDMLKLTLDEFIKFVSPNGIRIFYDRAYSGVTQNIKDAAKVFELEFVTKLAKEKYNLAIGDKIVILKNRLNNAPVKNGDVLNVTDLFCAGDTPHFRTDGGWVFKLEDGNWKKAT